jgi:hypothetical protein
VIPIGDFTCYPSCSDCPLLLFAFYYTILSTLSGTLLPSSKMNSDVMIQINATTTDIGKAVSLILIVQGADYYLYNYTKDFEV